MKALMLIIMLTMLNGCIKYVDVPVWVCPAPNIPIQEKLKTDSVSENASEGDILKAMVWDIVYLKGRAQSLELLLEGYKQPPADLQKLLPQSNTLTPSKSK